MIGMIITGHGQYGEGVLSSLEMIAGRNKEIVAINFLESDNLESLADKFNKEILKLKESCDSVLIVCDLAGGTPFNTAVMVSKDDTETQVIAGSNLATLLQVSIMKNTTETLQELVDMAVNEGNEVIPYKHKIRKYDQDEGGI